MTSYNSGPSNTTTDAVTRCDYRYSGIVIGGLAFAVTSFSFGAPSASRSIIVIASALTGSITAIS